MLLRARRPFRIAGIQVSAGEVIDLAPMNLPAGRAQSLVDTRYGEYVTADAYDCATCGRSFGSSHALSIHAGRSHGDTN